MERSQTYSLRSWISDLVLWSASTELDPVRQGPVAALQISGSARELIREIPPHVLQHGQVNQQTGVHTPGIMILAETLVQRYAPLEAETAARSVAELMSFRKLPTETVDGFLVRFDILRNRAANRGGMALNWEGMGWLLLNALGVNPEVWDRLLFANEGRMPNNEIELNQLMERIRRMGHNYEGGYRQQTPHHGAVGDPGQFFQQNQPDGYFPVFSGNQPTVNTQVPFPTPDQQAFWGATQAGGFPTPMNAIPTNSPMTNEVNQAVFNAWQEHDECCQTCGMYFQDEDISSATSTEFGGEFSGPETEQFLSVEGADDTAVGNELYEAYLVARRRWRKFTGKPPRRYRKFMSRSDKMQRNRSRMNQSPFARTYASFLPTGAFAGGKGKGKNKSSQGKSSYQRKNPRGRDGRTLLCAKCGSDSHLWRQCPNAEGGGKGQPSPPSMAMLANITSLPGVSFSYMTHSNSGPQHFDVSTPPSSSRGSASRAAGLHHELEPLRSVSQASQSSRSRKHGSPEIELSNEQQRASKSSRSDRALSEDNQAGSKGSGKNSNVSQFAASPVLASFMSGTSTFVIPGSSSTDAGKPSNSFMFRQVPNTWASGNMFPGSHAVAQGDEQPREFTNSECDLHDEMPAPSNRPDSNAGSRIMSPAVVSQNSPNSPEQYLTAASTPEPRHWRNSAQVEFHTPPNQSAHNSMSTPSPVGHVSGDVPSGSQVSQNRTVLNLSSMLGRFQGGGYPWWDCAQNQADPEMYHVRTRLSGQVGLLVDPGAHDNLIGSETAELMAVQLKAEQKTKTLDRALTVSGVGKSSQEATSSTTVECAFRDVSGKLKVGSYTAPVVPHSSLPPLLGLKSLRAKNAIVDTASPALILPGAGGIEFKLSPGSQVHPLTMSESGHLILPVCSVDPGVRNSRGDVEALDFAMQCRKSRSRSTSRNRKSESENLQ